MGGGGGVGGGGWGERENRVILDPLLHAISARRIVHYVEQWREKFERFSNEERQVTRRAFSINHNFTADTSAGVELNHGASAYQLSALSLVQTVRRDS